MPHSSWIVIVLMALAANLPFFTQSLFGVIRLKPVAKAGWLRLLELLLYYFLVLGLAWVIESYSGNRFPQGWQFYAATGCLFLVLAFPGFVYRYLRRQVD
jgi:hypothetical protein